MIPGTDVAQLLRLQLADILAGAFFVFVGLIAFSIAASRPRGGVKILFWLGLWSAMFGANDLLGSSAFAASFPAWFDVAKPWLTVSFTYLILVAAILAFIELTLGGLRQFLQLQLIVTSAIAVAAIGWFAVSGAGDTFLVLNQLSAAVLLVVLVLVLSIPRLSCRYLALSRHRVLTVGTLIFAAEALWVNVARPLQLQVSSIYSNLGFAILLLSLGYTALEMILSNERRLLAIDSELEIARQLQASILPERTPTVADLKIAATYLPMTAVAGDFYEFLSVDDHRAGFLVADVSGHGVPAALIASMIKVASQSVQSCASDPAQVLRRLGQILSSHLRGQFVSAAYLWIDTDLGIARYSAAGHPPLLQWRAAGASLSSIESNGLLFGVLPDCEYPVREIPLVAGDRFLMYTDGVTEPENSAGEQFGDKRLEQIVSSCRSCSAIEISKRLIEESRSWQPTALTQQDDVTLIVIDVG
jgi:phosphoserine phosphatase RsbU/P